jgi:glycosyltransferase involved in cell wall biosynthesis
MTEFPLISIIVPVYKVEKYLRKCVDSLIAQTYPNIEILLVDDGSPDSCPMICDGYANIYKNIRSFHKTNGGLSDARNYGTRQAAGNWIVYVDSDDYVLPDYIKDLWLLKEKHDADLAMAWVIRVDESGKTLGRKLSFNDFSISGQDAIFEIYENGTHVGWNAYNKLYSRDILLQIPFPDGYYEDMACMYKILEKSNKVAIGDFNQNYCYVQRSGSILNSHLSEKHFHIFEICDEFVQFVESKYPSHKALKAVIIAKATIQMLHSQIMDKNSFERIFNRNIILFRKNMLRVLLALRLNARFKIVYFLLCTNPALYHKCRGIKFSAK